MSVAAHARDLPPWTGAADRALASAAEEIRLIHAATPVNAARDIVRLEEGWARGVPLLPDFRYEPKPARAELLGALENLANAVEPDGPLGLLYAERARELLLEAMIIDAIGTHRVRELAERRFVGTDAALAADVARADACADAWSREPPGSPRDRGLVSTDDPTDPRSLVATMAAEVGRRKLALRVVVKAGLASLAATGEGVILVAAGHRVRPIDVARTVLHEIDGHVLPRIAAAAAPIGLFAIGTARGIDDQEGRALLLEREAGFFDRGRRRELSLRHLAAAATLKGAEFPEVVRLLLARGAPVTSAIRIVARVQRGGGLSREIVYLPALLRVERARDEAPVVERMMAWGRIAAGAASTVARAIGNPAEDEVA